VSTLDTFGKRRSGEARLDAHVLDCPVDALQLLNNPLIPAIYALNDRLAAGHRPRARPQIRSRHHSLGEYRRVLLADSREYPFQGPRKVRHDYSESLAFRAPSWKLHSWGDVPRADSLRQSSRMKRQSLRGQPLLPALCPNTLAADEIPIRESHPPACKAGARSIPHVRCRTEDISANTENGACPLGGSRGPIFAQFLRQKKVPRRNGSPQCLPKARAPQLGLVSPTTGTQAAPSSGNKTRWARFSSQCLLHVCRNISPRPMHALDICADCAQLLNNPLIPAINVIHAVNDRLAARHQPRQHQPRTRPQIRRLHRRARQLRRPAHHCFPPIH